MSTLLEFLALATREEIEQLATDVQTRKDYLRFHLGRGRRTPSPDLAAKLEHASIKIAEANGGRTPILWRTDTCAACGGCELARQHVGAAKRNDG